MKTNFICIAIGVTGVFLFPDWRYAFGIWITAHMVTLWKNINNIESKLEDIVSMVHLDDAPAKMALRAHDALIGRK